MAAVSTTPRNTWWRPEALPKELHWFKYEAYYTWVSGFLLLCLVYYFQAAHLPDRSRRAGPDAGAGHRA